jgi:hypothetical protein
MAIPRRNKRRSYLCRNVVLPVLLAAMTRSEVLRMAKSRLQPVRSVSRIVALLAHDDQEVVVDWPCQYLRRFSLRHLYSPIVDDSSTFLLTLPFVS